MSRVFDSIFQTPIGGTIKDGKPVFTLVSEDSDCGVVLFDRSTGAELVKLPFAKEHCIGNVHYMCVEGYDPKDFSYCFYRGDELIPDENATMFANIWAYGDNTDASSLRAILTEEVYDWEEDVLPKIPYKDSIVYCLHMRGFTAHKSSGVKAPGTFKGLQEKIPYLKSIGVTTLELQPIYEYLEKPIIRRKSSSPAPTVSLRTEESSLNYWGYTKGYYFAPKANYASDSKCAAFELKSMVKALHKENIEVILQFYFPDEVDLRVILPVLHYWMQEYHIDGFHLMGIRLPIELIADDPFLADTKLFINDISEDIKNNRKQSHLAAYNDSYLYDIRRFLKGDEGMMEAALYHLRHIPHSIGRIHFLSNYYGFTLADTYAYDRKHNEANGEENRDGNDYNCSWNCGEEGTTKSRKILQLRQQMIKNAFAFLLLSQSTPLIFMGDEFGNSQLGNNNPYNQDNEITYLDWSLAKKNKKLLEFWQKLVTFRKEHAILHPADELLLMDTLSIGYPDLSYHGESAWKVQTEGYIRHGGIMLCENYAAKEKDKEQSFLYVGLNMHWEKHLLALPKLPKDMRWVPLLTTADSAEAVISELSASNDNCVDIPARAFIVFASQKIEVPTKKRKR